MKVSNIVFTLAYAAACAASTDYANSAPVAIAPQLPLVAASPAPSVPVTPIPVVVADFIYPPAPPLAYSSSVPSAAPAPASLSPLPEPSMSQVLSPIPAMQPAPPQAYHANTRTKRSLDGNITKGLVSGTDALVFNANGSSYILARLPVDLAEKAAQNPSALHRRATESNLIAEATTKDLDSNAVLYDLVGKIFARITLPVNVDIGISNPTDETTGDLLRRDNLLENLLGEVVASAVAPLNIVANINPDEDGNGLLPNLLGRVSATIQASPTVTAHLFDANKDDSGDLLRRDNLLENLLGEVVASAVAPLNIVANINPDEDGNGLLPNLLGRVSATIQASPTVTAHLFDADKDDSGDLLRRGNLLGNVLGEVDASAIVPFNIVADISPDEDENGLIPNLLGRISATVQGSPALTAHLFGSEKSDSGKLLKKDSSVNGIFTEYVDESHIAIYVPLAAFSRSQTEVSELIAANTGSMQVVNLLPTPTEQVSSAPTPAATNVVNKDIFLRIVIPSSKLY